MRTFHRAGLAFASAALLLVAGSISAAPAARPTGPSAEHGRIVAHWTAERRAAAIPRDLVIDERGYGYLKMPDGSLQRYGHSVAASRASSPQPMAKPGGGGAPGDTTGPSVSGVDPNNKQIGTSYTFKATVTDVPSGVRSVTFKITKSGSRTQSFSATRTTGDVWQVALSGFTDGSWSWTVVAKDNASNTTNAGPFGFTVGTSSGGGVVTNATWTQGGVVQDAVGRIYFEMPGNSSRTNWSGYVCSGTVAADATTGRSVIQTAAHCVYDDAAKAFARNVLFIPYQDGTTAGGTDLNCGNDPYGCWSTAFGVVDVNWTTRTFPDNVAWDYAYYVVADSDAHTPGLANRGAVLDAAVTPMTVKFTTPTVGNYTHAFGYSYSADPNFKYCAENLQNRDAANWWLGSCGLSGGSSGGPWIQPLTGGDGPLISVNSWGFTNQPGMAGPKLSGTSAESVFGCATSEPFFTDVDGDEGVTYNGGTCGQ